MKNRLIDDWICALGMIVAFAFVLLVQGDDSSPKYGANCNCGMA